jgi:hypothetical protein
LLCHSLQQDISKYKEQEAEAQARLEDFNVALGWEDVPQENFDTVLANHPDNKAQVRVVNRPALPGLTKHMASNVFGVPY